MRYKKKSEYFNVCIKPIFFNCEIQEKSPSALNPGANDIRLLFYLTNLLINQSWFRAILASRKSGEAANAELNSARAFTLFPRPE